jgi:2,4-dienoyl-CoA reductase-like NADH-dependent reductase (Old Yellow Enzyme family)
MLRFCNAGCFSGDFMENAIPVSRAGYAKPPSRSAPATCGGAFDAETAARWFAGGRMDVAVFARKHLANLDLPGKFRLGAALNPLERSTFYRGARSAARISLRSLRS